MFLKLFYEIETCIIRELNRIGKNQQTSQSHEAKTSNKYFKPVSSYIYRYCSNFIFFEDSAMLENWQRY